MDRRTWLSVRDGLRQAVRRHSDVAQELRKAMRNVSRLTADAVALAGEAEAQRIIDTAFED